MKTIKVFTMFLFVLMGFACNDDETETVRINILPTVEINQDDYTPLKSANSEDSLVYAVQIYEGDAPIYYGLFNDISKMEIVLTTNKKYTLKVSAYQNGTGLGLKTLAQNGVIKYYLPDTVRLLNKFVLGDRLVGISDVSNAKLKYNNYSEYPEIDVFYQETEVSVIKGMTSVDVPLKRTGFGLGISVDGLSSGEIEVYFAGDTINLTPSIKSYFTIRSFTGGTKGLADVAKVDTYFVNSTIGVKWVGNNGSVVSASKTIMLKRNYQLPLYINFNSTNAGITIDSWKNDIADSIIGNNPPTLGLVAWYPFNGNANDESGNGNDGTIDGAFLTEDRFGYLNSAFELNGSSSITTDTIVQWGQQLSISFWFKPNIAFNSATSRQDIIAGNYTLPIPFQIYYKNGNIVVELWGNNGVHFYSSPSTDFDITSWNHIVLSTKADFIIYLSINGITYSIGEAPAPLRDNPSTVIFGRSVATPSYYYNGKIDDVGIWNRVLTQQEIENLYSSK